MVIRQGKKIDNGAAGAGLLVVCAEDDAFHPGVDERACAHRAGLQRDIHCTFPQPPAAQGFAGIENGLQLRMGQRVFASFPTVTSAANDTVSAGDDSADGNLPLQCGKAGEEHRFPHAFLVRHAFVSPFHMGPGVAFLLENEKIKATTAAMKNRNVGSTVENGTLI